MNDTDPWLLFLYVLHPFTDVSSSEVVDIEKPYFFLVFRGARKLLRMFCFLSPDTLGIGPHGVYWQAA